LMGCHTISKGNAPIRLSNLKREILFSLNAYPKLTFRQLVSVSYSGNKIRKFPDFENLTFNNNT